MTAVTLIRGKATLTMAGLRAKPATPRDGFRVSAQSPFLGIETLAQQSPVPLMACAVLAGFAVECALKSYLVTSFVSARALKKRYGHNLSKLWRTAVRYGLPIAKRPPAWCIALNRLTTGPAFFARYHTGVHGLRFPSTSRMVRGIRKLLT